MSKADSYVTILPYPEGRFVVVIMTCTNIAEETYEIDRSKPLKPAKSAEEAKQMAKELAKLLGLEVR